MNNFDIIKQNVKFYSNEMLIKLFESKKITETQKNELLKLKAVRFTEIPRPIPQYEVRLWDKKEIFTEDANGDPLTPEKLFEHHPWTKSKDVILIFKNGIFSSMGKPLDLASYLDYEPKQTFNTLSTNNIIERYQQYLQRQAEQQDKDPQIELKNVLEKNNALLEYNIILNM